MDYRYDHILIRYGELSLKGKNRKNFIHKLLENLKKALKGFPALEFETQYDRMYLYLHGEDPHKVGEIVSRVFGISSFSPAIKVPAAIEDILEAVRQCVDLSRPQTFKIKARRHDKLFEMDSDAINRAAAAVILKNSSWKVDVHHPQVTILIEVRQEAAYIMAEKIEGAGGFPVGIGGRAMLMLSGGIDSPVAGYLMMKRGVHLEAVHFAAPPYTSADAREKVLSLARQLAPYQGDLVVHVVPFTTLQLAIYKYAPESYAITLMRRMMMRIAAGLGENRHCLAIATGESIGQVASQTLESISVISCVTPMPILRPVICMDKVEIIETARRIQTYETSILPFEDCCTIFTPKAPATKPKLEKCLEYESRWDWESMVKDCIALSETIRVSAADAQPEEDLF